MIDLEKEKRRLNLKNVLAVNRLEGWETDQWYIDLMNDYVEGRRSLDSIMEDLVKEATENKGFSHRG